MDWSIAGVFRTEVHHGPTPHIFVINPVLRGADDNIGVTIIVGIAAGTGGITKPGFSLVAFGLPAGQLARPAFRTEEDEG